MNLTAQFLDTDIKQAALLSYLSGRPAWVREDIFIWNGHIIDRATAIVALLKVKNQIPVSDGVKKRMYKNYVKKFEQYADLEELLDHDKETIDEETKSRVWFNRICRIIKTENLQSLSNDITKNILIELHNK